MKKTDKKGNLSSCQPIHAGIKFHAALFLRVFFQIDSPVCWQDTLYAQK